jgi:hypothetical protein
MRIIRGLEARNGNIALHLTGNLQRADPDAVDPGAAHLGFFRARHGEPSVEEVVTRSITHGRAPG